MGRPVRARLEFPACPAYGFVGMALSPQNPREACNLPGLASDVVMPIGVWRLLDVATMVRSKGSMSAIVEKAD